MATTVSLLQPLPHREPFSTPTLIPASILPSSNAAAVASQCFYRQPQVSCCLLFVTDHLLYSQLKRLHYRYSIVAAMIQSITADDDNVLLFASHNLLPSTVTDELNWLNPRWLLISSVYMPVSSSPAFIICSTDDLPVVSILTRSSATEETSG